MPMRHKAYSVQTIQTELGIASSWELEYSTGSPAPGKQISSAQPAFPELMSAPCTQEAQSINAFHTINARTNVYVAPAQFIVNLMFPHMQKSPQGMKLRHLNQNIRRTAPYQFLLSKNERKIVRVNPLLTTQNVAEADAAFTPNHSQELLLSNSQITQKLYLNSQTASFRRSN